MRAKVYGTSGDKAYVVGNYIYNAMLIFYDKYLHDIKFYKPVNFSDVEHSPSYLASLQIICINLLSNLSYHPNIYINI